MHAPVIKIEEIAIPSNISIAFERDASIRAVEIIVINYDRAGNECQAIRMIAQDNGKFYKVSGAVDLIDGVDIIA